MKDDEPFVILGAGGHAAALIDALEAAGDELPFAAICLERSLWGTSLLGTPVVGDDSQLPLQIEAGARGFVVGVGSTGDTRLRQALFERGLSLGLCPRGVRHPSATVSASASCGDGLQALAGAVIGPRAMLGRNVLVNTRAVVEHDCRIEDHVHVASGAILCGGVRIGEGAHIGAGAVIKQGVAIGAGAIVGAGAVVLRDVPSMSVNVGVPARTLRTVD